VSKDYNRFGKLGKGLRQGIVALSLRSSIG